MRSTLRGPIRPRVTNGPAASRTARARTSSSRSRSNTSVSTRTLPPQHWPRSGPKVSRLRVAAGASRESASRAAPIARHSSSPPPIDPWKPPSGAITMRAPGSRGAEPRTAATVTSAQRPCEPTISATTDQIRIGSALRAHWLSPRAASGPGRGVGPRPECALHGFATSMQCRIRTATVPFCLCLP